MEGPAALIYNSFEHISDPHVERGQNHDLLEMIFIALTASICGANGWGYVGRFAKTKVDWFQRYIDLKHTALPATILSVESSAGSIPGSFWHQCTTGSISSPRLSVEDKSNEVPAVPMLLELLDWASAAVTLDGMCQRL